MGVFRKTAVYCGGVKNAVDACGRSGRSYEREIVLRRCRGLSPSLVFRVVHRSNRRRLRQGAGPLVLSKLTTKVVVSFSFCFGTVLTVCIKRAL